MTSSKKTNGTESRDPVPSIKPRSGPADVHRIGSASRSGSGLTPAREESVLEPREWNQEERRQHVPEQQVHPDQRQIEGAEPKASDQRAERSVGLQERASPVNVNDEPPSVRTARLQPNTAMPER